MSCSLQNTVYLPLPWTSVHWLIQSALECHWNATGRPCVYWDTTGKLLKLPHTGKPLEKLWLLQRTLNTTGGTATAPHTQAHTVRQSSIYAILKWQDDGTQSSKWSDLCKFNFYLEFTALQWKPVLLFKRVSTSTSFCACLGYEHHYTFCVFEAAVQMKSA